MENHKLKRDVQIKLETKTTKTNKTYMQKQKIMKIKHVKIYQIRVFFILLGVHQTDEWGKVQTQRERERKKPESRLKVH